MIEQTFASQDPTGIRDWRRATHVKSKDQKRRENNAAIAGVVVAAAIFGISVGAYELSDHNPLAAILAFAGGTVFLGFPYALMASEYTDDDSTY